MRLPDEYEERGMGTPVIYTIVAVSAFILIILAVVFASNNGKKNSGNGVSGAAKMSPSPSPTEDVTFAEGQEDIEALYKEHKLRAEDLDFWDMYQNNDVVVEAVPTQSPSPEPSHEPTEEEMATDGKHVKITHKDGEEEWVNISDEISLATYDFTNLKISGGKMAYYQDGEKKSWLGVDLSEDSGEVGFQVLKDSGIDFVMIRLGSRGYESGLISLPDKPPG